MAGGLAHSLLLYEDQSLWAVGHDAHGGLGSRLGGDFATTPVQVGSKRRILPWLGPVFPFRSLGWTLVFGLGGEQGPKKREKQGP